MAMNLRKNSILDTLVRGNKIPQPNFINFIELERSYSNGKYSRKWFALDSKKQCENTSELIEGVNSTLTKRIRRTRNKKLIKLLYYKSFEGLTVEQEDTQEDDPII